ncbi:hypothetical protein MPDQ_006512 [Monascus purpureus]|uniref:SUZ domain-containing protein n=1 Tax=Monascus purpureus TaxID=5098 RepID=A0A507QXM3_MONPU|nr:hypothetical protein MPDQ_006512 [Monascus purpureus]
MSAKSSTIPDAWDDDWEKQADHAPPEETTAPPPGKKVSSKVTKAQRRAQQAEFNRQLWAEAESPQAFHFLETRSNVPLKQDIKPAVTLLSRKPQIASRQSSSTVKSATAGVGRLGLADDGSDDSEYGANKEPELTPEERQAMALRNLEEKQRKYEEVRERLFGSPSNAASGASSTGSATPPRQQYNGERRGKGRSRGGGRENRERRDSSAASGKSRRLYDPDCAAKPNSSYVQRKERPRTDDRNWDQQQAPLRPLRSPRQPDPSGRAGFGFGNRA